MPPELALPEAVEPAPAQGPAEALAASTVAASTVAARPAEPAVLPPTPVIADALRAPVPTGKGRAGLLWLLAWILSLAVTAGAVFAAWYGRVPIEHAVPRTLWLFRLLPGGVPV